ncbi:type II toxin-antitoxin system RelE/ParE family toxin [Marinomonas transparens]|uniref:Type II toxin-antitoxin system RelE/ParE family toxin n=1 Tax=Marinomonas transparens TaxID=2795388 RepID=A0A934JZD5_9GAMM|nr:type II toxin-antitoxin system RelE/ParE family toxin [Marinomonas transparens]MBJ7540095.1 type II toxin-antitoxin system RelE/ParE family toxin [Marinomonas transparens]
MKSYHVMIKPTAVRDLALRFQQITEDSPDNAITWYLGVIKAIEKLDVLAERCPLAPEDADIQQGIRHLIIGSYRVLYRINGKDVDVLHVRHSVHDRVL